MGSTQRARGSQALEAGQPIDLVCLGGGYRLIRSRLPPDGSTLLVRPGISQMRPVPGDIFTLEVERTWVFGHTDYAKGLVTGSRLDVARLELEPLGLEEWGWWDPEEKAELFEAVNHPLYEEIQAAGARPHYGMELVIPEHAVEPRRREDPVHDAVELANAGAVREAEDLLGDLLTADLRCLDAHAHLGNFAFNGWWPFDPLDRASRHFRTGVEIGDLALGDGFDGVLLWTVTDNRPYLRCLHGHGLCLWRRGDRAAASEVFRRMLWLNPNDNQGARFLLADVEAGRSWEELVAEESDA